MKINSQSTNYLSPIKHLYNRKDLQTYKKTVYSLRFDTVYFASANKCYDEVNADMN